MLSDTLSFFTTSLRTAKGIEKNIIARKCIEKIEYGIDQIQISFWLKADYAPDSDSKNYAPEKYTHAPDEKIGIIAQNQKKPSEFGKFPLVPRSEQPRTVKSVLPNVIHGSKLLDMPARRVEAQK